MGSQIKVYVSKVDNNGKNLLILLSRTHQGLVKRLFELEIPEINDGTVMLYSVARDPGNRSKVAVYSERANIDPIGACIGEKGNTKPIDRRQFRIIPRPCPENYFDDSTAPEQPDLPSCVHIIFDGGEEIYGNSLQYYLSSSQRHQRSLGKE